MGLSSHSERVPKQNWLLERVLVTPSNHRVHHSKQMKYADKNFAVMFILWDVIFGTFKEEGDDVRIDLFGMRARETYSYIVLDTSISGRTL